MEVLVLRKLPRVEVNSISHSSSLTLVDKLAVPHRAAITMEAAMQQVVLKA